MRAPASSKARAKAGPTSERRAEEEALDRTAKRLAVEALMHVARHLLYYVVPDDAAAVVTEGEATVTLAIERVGPLLSRLEGEGDAASARHVRTAAESGRLPALVVLLSGLTKIYGVDREALAKLPRGRA